MSRAAVVVNPTKLDDDEAFRKSVRRVMDDHGWDEPLWLETTREDTGRGQAESAVSAGVDLLLDVPPRPEGTFDPVVRRRVLAATRASR